MIKIYLPELGEGIAKATLSYWYVEEGAAVTEGSELAEVTTDKAVFNVPAPCSGTVAQIVAHEGDVVEIGSVLAIVEEDTVSEAPEEENEQSV